MRRDPDSVAVPLQRSVNVMPVGSAPTKVSAGVGEPVVVTVKENGEPETGVADALLVNCGTVETVRTNDCVTTPPTLVAVKVTGKV